MYRRTISFCAETCNHSNGLIDEEGFVAELLTGVRVRYVELDERNVDAQ
jgi:hypothetical protein